MTAALPTPCPARSTASFAPAPVAQRRASLRGAWARARAWWTARRRAAQDLRDLQAMSPRDLLDLGLGRGQIDRISGTCGRDRSRW